MNSRDQDEFEADDVGSVPTFFREHEEFFGHLDMITTMAGDKGTWSKDGSSEEEAQLVRKATSILEGYQEQPNCLDPHLERIVDKLMSAVQEYVYAFYDNSMAETTASGSSRISMSRMTCLFDLAYTICKVRGYKVVLRFFPHGVADVEPVFAMLWLHSSVDAGEPSWTTKYILLIWLSLLAMVPFDMDSIDSGLLSLPPLSLSTINSSGRINASASTLVARWIELGKLHLNKSGCEMEGSAVMLARLLSRRDTLEKEQPEFISWAIQEISESSGLATTESSNGDNGDGGGKDTKALGISSVLRINGALRVLCHLFSEMDSPVALSGRLERLLTIFQSGAFEQHSVTRKLICKAAQRMALLFLPPKPPTFAYNRTSLRDNLGHTTDGTATSDISDRSHLDGNALAESVDQGEEEEE
ncbi:hypothetical protein H4S06_003616, partial [Coemansia sp. BCRC 34490]